MDQDFQATQNIKKRKWKHNWVACRI